MKKSKFAALPLICLGLLGCPKVQAAGPHLEDVGAIEHYHHEFYSHSYVDPNYRDDSADPPSGGLSKSKRHGKPIKRNTNVSIAFGGHRHHKHR